ncbi:MAG: hypothetical protein Q7R35_01780 [Elusimicrobiota bacterium]|nr:hypothetical protein [Elusimicrobiota bacterium]
MNPELVKVLLAAAVIIGAGLAAGYYIVRYLKGSITISLPGTGFSPGDQVEGSFQLLTRREVRGNALTAALVASETTRERGYNGKSTTHTREIFRTGQTLEREKVYPAGYTANYDFKIAVPSEQAPAGSGSMMGQALNMLTSLGGLGRRISWKVEVRLDAEGVDLASTRNITVGGSGLF